MSSNSLSDAERLSELQVRLADLTEQFETSSWADVDIIELHWDMLDTERRIKLLENNFDEQL